MSKLLDVLLGFCTHGPIYLSDACQGGPTMNSSEEERMPSPKGSKRRYLSIPIVLTES